MSKICSTLEGKSDITYCFHGPDIAWRFSFPFLPLVATCYSSLVCFKPNPCLCFRKIHLVIFSTEWSAKLVSHENIYMRSVGCKYCIYSTCLLYQWVCKPNFEECKGIKGKNHTPTM